MHADPVSMAQPSRPKRPARPARSLSASASRSFRIRAGDPLHSALMSDRALPLTDDSPAETGVDDSTRPAPVAGRAEGTFPTRVAAIDIGSNAIRFIATEFTGPSASTVLDQVRAPVRLGHDVFLTGRLTDTAMTAAVEALTG
jgi:hypothetical protein